MGAPRATGRGLERGRDRGTHRSRRRRAMCSRLHDFPFRPETNRANKLFRARALGLHVDLHHLVLGIGEECGIDRVVMAASSIVLPTLSWLEVWLVLSASAAYAANGAHREAQRTRLRPRLA